MGRVAEVGRLISMQKARMRARKVTYQGIPIKVDRPRGHVQHGMAEDGTQWSRTYKTDYGFIPYTEGGDEEELDVYLGPDPGAKNAHWIVQTKADGSFDEFKLMLGFGSRAAAKAMWAEHTPEKYFGGMTTTGVSLVKSLVGIHPGVVLRQAASTADSGEESAEESFAKGASDFIASWIADRDLDTERPVAAAMVREAGFEASQPVAQRALLAKLDLLDEAMLDHASGGADLAPCLKGIFGFDPPADDEVEPALSVSLIKAVDEDERFVLGIALVPEQEDLQGEVYSAAVIRKAAHEYMRTWRRVKIQHDRPADHLAYIAESYIAPIDLQLGERLVKAGSWVVGMKILGDQLWSDFKAGLFTGFSVGGTKRVLAFEKSAPARVHDADSYGPTHAAADQQAEAHAEATGRDERPGDLACA